MSDESSSESLAGINVLDSSESVVASAVVDAVLGVGETPGLAGAVRLLNGNLGGDGLVEEELAGEGGLASLVAVGLILAVPGDVASNVNLHVHVHGAALVPSRENGVDGGSASLVGELDPAKEGAVISARAEEVGVVTNGVAMPARRISPQGGGREDG